MAPINHGARNDRKMTPVLTSKVQARSLVDVVTERLEAAIISGELPPGKRLSEQGLANSLGVSRGPLREAIRRLEGRALLERTPNIGVRVAALSPAELDDLLVVREALEGMACALATEHLTAGELAELEELLLEHESQKGIQTGEGYYQESRDFDFHFRIARASRNDRLIAMICGDLYDLLRIYRYKSSTLKGRAAQALGEHRQILQALKERNPEKAESKMRAHIRSARKHAAMALAQGAEPGDLPRPDPLASRRGLNPSDGKLHNRAEKAVALRALGDGGHSPAATPFSNRRGSHKRP